MVKLTIIQGVLDKELKGFIPEQETNLEFVDWERAINAAETLMLHARAMRAIRKDYFGDGAEYDTISTLKVELLNIDETTMLLRNDILAEREGRK